MADRDVRGDMVVFTPEMEKKRLRIIMEEKKRQVKGLELDLERLEKEEAPRYRLKVEELNMLIADIQSKIDSK